MKGSEISSSDSSLLIYTIVGLHKREQIVSMISWYPDEMVDIFILTMPCMDFLYLIWRACTYSLLSAIVMTILHHCSIVPFTNMVNYFSAVGLSIFLWFNFNPRMDK